MQRTNLYFPLLPAAGRGRRPRGGHGRLSGPVASRDPGADDGPLGQEPHSPAVERGVKVPGEASGDHRRGHPRPRPGRQSG